MKEPFWDERPTPDDRGWLTFLSPDPESQSGWEILLRNPPTGIGDGYFDLWNEDQWFILEGDWTIHEQLILLDGEGYVLLSPEGEILQGMNGCIDIKVECQIAGDSGGSHVRCLLLTNSLDPQVTGTLLDKFPASSTKLFVRWQTGHYPHSSINTARFRINGIVSSWFTLPLQGSYVEFAEVAVRDGIVNVKYLL